MQHQQIIHRPTKPDIKTDQRGKQDKEGEPGLEKVSVRGNPTAIGDDRPSQWLHSCFHDFAPAVIGWADESRVAAIEPGGSRANAVRPRIKHTNAPFASKSAPATTCAVAISAALLD